MQGLVVGTVALSEPGSLAATCSQYTLSAAFDAVKYNAAAFASLSMCAINPIFSAQTRDILSAASDILRRPVILASPAEASAASGSGAFAGVFQHLPPAPGAMPPPLLVLSPPLTYHRKLALDVHVVVVGASKTALAALRSIMLRHDTALPRVTLLAPLGSAAAPALQDPQLAAVMNDARVTVLDASMVALDRYDSMCSVKSVQHWMSPSSSDSYGCAPGGPPDAKAANCILCLGTCFDISANVVLRTQNYVAGLIRLQVRPGGAAR
jgi:hypothetical protein